MNGTWPRSAAAALLASFAVAASAQIGWGTSSKGYDAKTSGFSVRETPEEIRIDLAADVLFDFDKSDITPKAADTLGRAADVIRKHKPKKPVRVEGHTDAKGSAEYNQGLSQKRAQSVRDWLASSGNLKGVRFETKGFGAQRPVAPNAKPDGSDDPEGRQKNRRVEIVIARR